LLSGVFRFNHTPDSEIYTLSLHDALPILVPTHFSNLDSILIGWIIHAMGLPAFIYGAGLNLFNIKIFAYFMNSLGAYKVDRRKKDRKSTRLNSSHVEISYAVFCLKKKKNK